MKSIVIISIIIAVTTLGGGGYWYLEVYRPAQYAKIIIDSFNELELFQQSLSAQYGGLGRKDYSKTFEISEKRDVLYASIHDNLASSRTPRKLSKIRDNFLSLLEDLRAANNDASQKVSFLIIAVELLDVLQPQELSVAVQQRQPIRPGGQEPQSIQPIALVPQPTAKEMLAIWEPRIPRAKAIAENLFSHDPPPGLKEMTDINTTELKRLWVDASRGLDVMLAYLKNLKQDVAISSSIPGDWPLQDVKYVASLSSFIDTLANVVNQNDAEPIVEYQTYTKISQRELFTRYSSFTSTVQELKNKYVE